ncbi:cytochrome P450 [Trametopsis cervina]|nr:cytochrome P450 [Trametopsis cervina]
MDVAIALVLSLTLLAGVIHIYIAIKSRRRSPYPPGPPGLPIVGNVHQLPQEFQERTFSEWGRQYGDIVFIRIFGKPAIVLNSVEVARDLLEKRGAVYSDRPPLIMLNEMMGWDCVVTHFPYGERFRKHRKWIQAGFQEKNALEGYRHIQHREACTLLLGLIDNPAEYESHIKRFPAAVLTEVAYGHRVTGLDDKLIALAEKAGAETVRAGSPGSNPVGTLVEFFPILKYYPLWLPGSGFKIRTNEIRDHVRRMMDIPYEMVKNRFSTGKAIPCFTASLLEDHLANNTLCEAEETDIKGAAGVIYAAGTDTSISVMNTFMLAMTRHPEVFKKAQQEIDRVVGEDRLPDFDDRASLSYLECIFMEVLRYACPAPLGIPHAVSRDDIYRGYQIPKGTMVIQNIWGMMRDPQLYPDPHRFLPERFEGLDKAQLDAIDPRHAVFGFGRRRCPGEQLASTSVYLMMSYVVATMDIARVRDQNGNEIVPSGEFHSGFVQHPKSFECSIKPRSEKATRLVRQMSAIA